MIEISPVPFAPAGEQALDELAHRMITERGAESCYIDYHPSFGAMPFGKVLCTSVNDAVLHGLPHDYALADGDLLTLDLAVLKAGVAADSAISFVVGESSQPESLALIETTQRALAAGIRAGGGEVLRQPAGAVGGDPEAGRGIGHAAVRARQC